MLRDPTDRYLSEFKHIEREGGGTWGEMKFNCTDKTFAIYKSSCYEGPKWVNLTFPEFLSCPFKYNLAFNRQTRMLANLSNVDCHNGELVYGNVMLESAKRNLGSMAFFGLKEYQEESNYLFEKTFGLKFMRRPLVKRVNETYSYRLASTLTTAQKLRVREANGLDRELYSYAKALFLKRLRYFRELDKRN